MGIEGAKCVESTASCAQGYETLEGGSVASSDCFFCSGGKVLSASVADDIGRCVEWTNFNSCEERYKISNRGFAFCG
jgi:hypothetical protein